MIPEPVRPAAAWVCLFAIAGVAMVFAYPDSYQQDAGTHFLQARWAWTHPSLFVGVWGRPLFTFLYAFPALLGYPAAKLFTLALCLVTAWQTARLAEQHGMERPAMAIPLLFLQPSFLLLSIDTMTEPLCALLFVIALRLHKAGKILPGLLVASLMVLATPWGFFLGVAWGAWVLRDFPGPWWKRAGAALLLCSGVVLWWLAALFLTRDPQWILHDWPKEWKSEGRYGTGSAWWYGRQMAIEVVGLLLIVPFLVSLVVLVRKRMLGMAASMVVTLFVLLTLMFRFGLFNAAGYARYLVCVAPAMALMVLAGWNAAAERLKTPRLRMAAAGVALALAGLYGAAYVDRWPFGRDALAAREMYAWFVANPRPVHRLGWSQAYMCILFNRDPWEKPLLTADREKNLELLRESPGGTLMFWDGATGPAWNRLEPADFESVGYVRLRSRSYLIPGRLPWSGPARAVEMHLFYKP